MKENKNFIIGCLVALLIFSAIVVELASRKMPGNLKSFQIADDGVAAILDKMKDERYSKLSDLGPCLNGQIESKSGGKKYTVKLYKNDEQIKDCSSSISEITFVKSAGSYDFPSDEAIAVSGPTGGLWCGLTFSSGKKILCEDKDPKSGCPDGYVQAYMSASDATIGLSMISGGNTYNSTQPLYTCLAAFSDKYTKILLHANGSDGSTTFTDFVNQITPNGDAKISTAQSKFGGSSAKFDGSGDYLSVPSSSSWNFDSNFTVDTWVYPTKLNTVIAKSVSNQNWSSAASNDWVLAYGADGRFSFYVKGYGIAGASGIVYSQNQWIHVAVVRSGSLITLYTNGNADGASISDSSNLGNTQSLEIGRGETNLAFDHGGYIDEFRISKGIARWTSSFAPPTSEYK